MSLIIDFKLVIIIISTTTTAAIIIKMTNALYLFNLVEIKREKKTHTDNEIIIKYSS